MERVDIAYVVSHGFALRMLIQTDLLGKLRDAGKTVAIITSSPDDSTLTEYCHPRDIKIVRFKTKNGFATENYQFKRKYFLEDLEANPALLEKHIHAVRYNTSLHPLRRVRPYYYWLIYKLIPRFPSIRQRFINKEARYLQSEDARAIVQELRPRKLIVTYPVDLNEASLLYYGNQHADVETWMHLLSWDNISCKGRFPQLADKYIAWGPIMRDELQSYYGVARENIYECGVPHFDLHGSSEVREKTPEVIKALGLDPERPYLLFAMSSPRFAPREIDIVEWLAREVQAGRFGDMQLLVRPHPQNVQGNMSDESWLPRLEKIGANSRVAIAYPTLSQGGGMRWSMQQRDMVTMAAQLACASVVLNSGSTMSIDALMHDRPVIITAFDGEETLEYWRSARRLLDFSHLKKFYSYEGISVVENYAFLVFEISRYLQSLEYKSAERRRATTAECYNADFGATDRVTQLLLCSDKLAIESITDLESVEKNGNVK